MGFLPANYSMVSSLALSVVTVAFMQMFREQIAVEGNLLRLALGGFAGSWLFIFLVTAMGNFYSMVFPRNPHVSLFPEIIVILAVSVVASAMVHRICGSTCLIFSLIALYYLNKMSQSSSSPSTGTHKQPQQQQASPPTGKVSSPRSKGNKRK